MLRRLTDSFPTPAITYTPPETRSQTENTGHKPERGQFFRDEVAGRGRMRGFVDSPSPLGDTRRAMSQENVELVRRLVDAINADAIPRDLFTSDFEIRNAVTAVTDATYVGYEGGLRWRRDLFDGVDDARFVLDEVLATGTDYLVIANSLVGIGSSSGAPVELRWTSALWFRDNKICRTVGYNRRRHALAAVGLAENTPKTG